MYYFIGEPPRPGETTLALVWLLDPDRNRGRLRVGFEYRVWEGKFIGTGRVLRVMNPILSADHTKTGDSKVNADE
jgi:hypothetical protein